MSELVAAALLPPAAVLAVDPWGWAPYGPAKWLAIVPLTFVALGLSWGGAPMGRGVRVLIGAVLGWVAVVSVGGADPRNAWLGTPERRLGWLTVVVFVAWFVVGARAASPVLVARGASAALLGLGLVCCAEALGFSIVDVSSSSDRLGGTFGSAAFTGAAAVLLLPVAVGMAATRGDRWRWVAVVAVGLSPVVVFGAASRASLIGLFVGGGVGMIALGRRIGWRRTGLIGGAVLAGGAVGLLVGPGGRRVGDLGAGVSSASRFDEWRVGLRTLAGHPWLGLGPEGYRTAFPRYVNARYARDFGREVVTDRAHNLFIDSGLVGGIVLVVLMVVVVGALGLAAGRVALRRESSAVQVGCALAVIGYLVHQMFLFPTLEVDPIFWLFAGLVVGADRRSDLAEPVPESTPESTPIGRGPVLTFGGIALALLIWGIADVAADHQLAEAERLADKGEQRAAVAAANRAVDLAPASTTYRLAAAAIAATPGTDAALTDAIEHIDAALDISPADPLFATRRAEWIGERAALRGDPQGLRAAVDVWRRVAGANPLDPAVRIGWGRAAAEAGDVRATDRQFALARDLQPRSVEPLVELALAELVLGRTEQAMDAIDAAADIDSSDPQVIAVRRLVERER